LREASTIGIYDLYGIKEDRVIVMSEGWRLGGRLMGENVVEGERWAEEWDTEGTLIVVIGGLRT